MPKAGTRRGTRMLAKRVQKVEVVKPKHKSGYGRIQRKPFKDHIIVKMDYGDWFNMNTAAIGLYAEYCYRLNSIFDPDFTGAGHQPYGFDTYQTLYSKYRVLKVEYTIRATAGVLNSCITVVPNNSLASIGSTTLAIETPRSQYKVMNLTADEVVIKGKLDLASFNGRTKEQYSADDVFESIMTTNPPEVMGLHIGISNVSGATLSNAQFAVRLRYIVEFFDPIQLSQS